MTKTAPRIFLLLCLSSAALSQPAQAQFIRVTGEEVNVRTNPNTTSTVVVQAKANDVFELQGQRGEWYEIAMFSGEYRYLHGSLAVQVDHAPALPSSADVRRRACIEIVRVQDRAVAEAERRYPTNYSRQVDLERLLYDRYELPVFHKFSISPARNSALVVECAKKRWLP